MDQYRNGTSVYERFLSLSARAKLQAPFCFLDHGDVRVTANNPDQVRGTLEQEFPRDTLVESGLCVVGNGGNLELNPLLVPAGQLMVALRDGESLIFELVLRAGRLAQSDPITSVMLTGDSHFNPEYPVIVICPTLESLAVLRACGMAAIPAPDFTSTDVATIKNRCHVLQEILLGGLDDPAIRFEADHLEESCTDLQAETRDAGAEAGSCQLEPASPCEWWGSAEAPDLIVLASIPGMDSVLPDDALDKARRIADAISTDSELWDFEDPRIPVAEVSNQAAQQVSRAALLRDSTLLRHVLEKELARAAAQAPASEVDLASPEKVLERLVDVALAGHRSSSIYGGNNTGVNELIGHLLRQCLIQVVANTGPGSVPLQSLLVPLLLSALGNQLCTLVENIVDLRRWDGEKDLRDIFQSVDPRRFQQMIQLVDRFEDNRPTERRR